MLDFYGPFVSSIKRDYVSVLYLEDYSMGHTFAIRYVKVVIMAPNQIGNG
jgi:predicted DNA-binding protein YlxM (UPF0122 family)